MADACLAPCVVDPAPSGGRALRLSSCHTRIACHGKAASPVVGRAVYAFIPEVSLSCPLILLRWQIWLTCKASPSTKKKKKKKKSLWPTPQFFLGPYPVQTSPDTALANQWPKRRVWLAFGYTTAGQFMDLYSQWLGACTGPAYACHNSR